MAARWYSYGYAYAYAYACMYLSAGSSQSTHQIMSKRVFEARKVRNLLSRGSKGPIATGSLDLVLDDI